MNSEQYQIFTNLLRQNLEADKRVLGLVALGSMAQQDYQPDRWSDHDFFVITESGEQEDFRRNLGWLPSSDEVALALRETDHGLKVLYRSGHLLEFAVFDAKELYLAKVNRYRVLLDRGAIAGHMEAIKASSTKGSTPAEEKDFKEFGMFIFNLLVGVGRYNRGEKFSGHLAVKTYAFQHLVVLLKKYLEAPRKDLLDNLDPVRRFERVFPEVGAELNQILSLETPQAALAMLDLAERELQDKLTNYPAEAVKIIREQIAG
jgi:hypothetical protein